MNSLRKDAIWKEILFIFITKKITLYCKMYMKVIYCIEKNLYISKFNFNVAA